MNVIRSFVDVIKTMAMQFQNIGDWFTTEIANVNGVSISPLTAITPALLIVILAYLIVRFLTV